MGDGNALNMLGLGLAVLVLLRLVKPMLYLATLLKAQFRYPQYALAAVEEVTDDLRDYLVQGAEPLLTLGFKPFTWLSQRSFEYSEHGDSHVLSLVHEQAGAYASVSAGSAGAGLRINFSAEFDDGSRLESLHGESSLSIAEYPNTEIVDTASADVGALWQCFETRLRELSRTRSIVRPEPAAWVASLVRWAAQGIDAWRARGLLQPTREPDRFELSTRHALRLAWGMGSGLAALAEFQVERAKLQPVNYPLSQQIRNYQKVRESAERRGTRWSLGSVLIISALLFALSMLRVADLRDIGLLLLVLLFHELGHYAAMRVFGYRDTSIFFIPFLGAAARGIKHDARIHEQLVVLLAGPLPGIVLGVLLRTLFPAALAHPQLRSLVDLLIIINVFNLFPAFPLDGGRIVQLIFGNLSPLIEVGFRSLGAVALLGMGLLASDAVLIAVAILLVLGIPSAKRAADAVRRIRALGPVPEQEDARLALLFSELRTNQPSLSPVKSYSVILPVAERLRHGQLSMPGFLAWCGTYVCCLCAGVGALYFGIGGARGGSSWNLGATRSAPLVCRQIDALPRVLQPGPGSFALRCSLRDPKRLARLVDSFQQFASLPSQSCLRAPWNGSAGRTPAQIASEARARNTVKALVLTRKRVLEEFYSSRASASDAVGALDARIRAERERYEYFMAKAKLAQRSYMETHRGDRDFDASVASLWLPLDTGSAADSDMDLDESTSTKADQRMETLLDKLGRRAAACTPVDGMEFTNVSAAKAVATVTGYRVDLRSGLSELAHYLCEYDCDIQYSVRMQSAAPQPRDSNPGARAAGLTPRSRNR